MRKEIVPQALAAEAGSSRGIWSQQESAKTLPDASPLQAGGGGFYGLLPLPPTSDFLVCVFGGLDCGFVVLWFVYLGCVGRPDSSR